MPEPFRIVDNSLLVEEAFNQESGVVQNIINLHVIDGGEWETTFTQEWPLWGQRHQLAYTLTYSGAADGSGLGDTQVHYRIQLAGEHGAWPAIAPRFTVFAPTGDVEKGLGRGAVAYQVNVPVSRQLGDVYWHWNAGFTHSPAEQRNQARWNLFTPHVGASTIWRAASMIHLMMETLLEWREDVVGGRTERHPALTLSPGVRGGVNVGDSQTVIAVATPIERVDGHATFGVFVYLSHELPFRH